MSVSGLYATDYVAKSAMATGAASQNSFLQTKLTAGLAQTGAATGTTASPRLVKAAHEFEASMMKELLAPMQPGKGLMGEDEDDSNSNAALTEFASEALGKAISEQGGLGIARSILHKLAPGNHVLNPSVPGIRPSTPLNSPPK
jgi:Rod binding domain-containing protein